MIELTFSTWEEFDQAISSIVSLETIITEGVKVQIEQPAPAELTNLNYLGE
jgi:hypothetical protein